MNESYNYNVQEHLPEWFPLHSVLHRVSTLLPPSDRPCSSKPLQIWDKNVRNGHIKRITDPDIQSSVLEIMGTNVSTNYITCPVDPKKTLAIKLPFLVMIIKNVSARARSPLSAVEEVLHLRGAGPRRQERAPPIPRLQLPEHHAREALHLHDAHAPRRGLEPDSVQLV